MMGGGGRGSAKTTIREQGGRRREKASSQRERERGVPGEIGSVPSRIPCVSLLPRVTPLPQSRLFSKYSHVRFVFSSLRSPHFAQSFGMAAATASPEKPRRNLTEAFEALVPPPLISPTGVTELEESEPFLLHPSLRRDLSRALVHRVSFYGIIHDMNKEANCMAQNDETLVAAVTGKEVTELSSEPQEAAIDEESWLLSTIATQKAPRACPPTFLQAMGEKEYATPSLGSRTQLWKPSRSWWEAKSGKNPWIEPASHNKRWR